MRLILNNTSVISGAHLNLKNFPKEINVVFFFLFWTNKNFSKLILTKEQKIFLKTRENVCIIFLIKKLIIHIFSKKKIWLKYLKKACWNINYKIINSEMRELFAKMTWKQKRKIVYQPRIFRQRDKSEGPAVDRRWKRPFRPFSSGYITAIISAETTDGFRKRKERRPIVRKAAKIAVASTFHQADFRLFLPIQLPCLRTHLISECHLQHDAF